VPYVIVLDPKALSDLRRLRANLRAAVQDALERFLRHTPTKVSRSRIKRLRGLEHPMFRLRVGDVRVYYDVRGDRVEVLAILDKSEAAGWLQMMEREGEE